MTPASAEKVPPGCTNATIAITTKASASAADPIRHQPVDVKAEMPSVTAAPSITIPKRIEIAETVVQSKRKTMTEKRSQQPAVTSFSHQNFAASPTALRSAVVTDVPLMARASTAGE